MTGTRVQRTWITEVNRIARTAVCCLLFASVAVQAPAEAACLRGVNVAGAEFGGYGGEYGRKYIYPSDATLDWAIARGMSAIRLPFRWERLQPELFAPFDPAEFERLRNTVERATQRGLTVIVDPHNYAGYRENKIGTGDVTVAAFADFWRRLAPAFANDDDVVYLLMNEPSGITAAEWFKAAQAGTDAIREVGADNLIMVPGTIWSGASHWFDDQPGGSNAEVMAKIRDPLDRFVFEFHQYMDEDFSGTHNTCPRLDRALLALETVSGWMRLNGFSGFLGEFGGTSSPDCLEAIAEIANFMNRQNDVWIGWTAWAAGHWWGGYPLSLHPKDGIDPPAMKALLPMITDPDGGAAACPSMARFR